MMQRQGSSSINRNNIKTELVKIFSDYRIYACTLAVPVAYLFNVAADTSSALRLGTVSVEELFVRMNNFGMVLVCFVFAITGGVFSYCTEVKSGNLRYIMLRNHLGSYVRAKVLSTLLSGFLTLLVGLALSELLAAAYVQVRVPGCELFLAGGEQLASNISSIVRKSLYGGVMAVEALLFTSIYPNYFVGITLPIVMHYLLMYVVDIFHIPAQFDYRMVYLAGADGFYENGLGYYLQDILYAVLYTACIVCLMGWAVKHMVKRRLENG